jgi:hypothetical protein
MLDNQGWPSKKDIEGKIDQTARVTPLEHREAVKFHDGRTQKIRDRQRPGVSVRRETCGIDGSKIAALFQR